jgi:retron-type reverse transcriptase
MKREGFLWEQALDPANLREAYRLAARGKRDRLSVRRFSENLDSRLATLRAELVSGKFEFGRFTQFTIHDPKRRVISAARFEERIAQHALMRVCGPILDRGLIPDTYACRVGKGRTRALKRAVEFAGGFRRVLKLDVRAYFASIDHRRLLEMLERRIKDARILQVFWAILSSHEDRLGVGLPIGSLTSQHFANLYLDPLDRWLKEERQCRGYVRYMDDFLVFGRERPEQLGLVEEIRRFLSERLGLTLKEPGEHDLREGVDFLGYRIRHRPGTPLSRLRIDVTLAKRSRRRFIRKMTELTRDLDEGQISELDFQRRGLALCEFTRCARALNLRRATVAKLETGADGRASRGPRRQLEQPAGELPLREPEREPSGQPGQQPGFPACAGPSSLPAKHGGGDGTGAVSSG